MSKALLTINQSKQKIPSWQNKGIHDNTKSVLKHPLLRILTPGPELIMIFMPVYSSTVLLTLKDIRGLCANNAVVLSELGCLGDNHLSGSGILPVEPEGRGSVLRTIFLRFTVTERLLFCFDF